MAAFLISKNLNNILWKLWSLDSLLARRGLLFILRCPWDQYYPWQPTEAPSQTSAMNGVNLETKGCRDLVSSGHSDLQDQAACLAALLSLGWSSQVMKSFYKPMSQKPVAFFSSPFGLEYARLFLSSKVISFFPPESWVNLCSAIFIPLKHEA